MNSNSNKYPGLTPSQSHARLVREKCGRIYTQVKYVHKLSLDAHTLPAEDFNRLSEMVPSARVNYGLCYSVHTENPDGDAFIQHALSLFKQRGLERRQNSSFAFYGYSIMRHYEPADLIGSDLLLVHYQRRLSSCKSWDMYREPIRDEHGRLLILASDADAKLKVGSAHYPDNMVVVSHEVRTMLEVCGLVGLQFGEVALKGKSSKVSPHPFWELQSSITLPKIANTGKLVHFGSAEAEPFRGDYSRNVLIDDSPFHGGELHYRRSDLAAVGVFDIATTFEKYLFSRPLVISQRFYQHCLKHKIPLAVEPVRIDPD